jgi:membrane-associated protein
VAPLLDVVLSLDEHLFALTEAHGAWVYLLLFAIVFAETGLIVTPVLPGDSLLFAAGTLCAAGLLDPAVMALVLTLAAIIGDAVNYSAGHFAGPRIFHGAHDGTRMRRWFRPEHLDRAHAFFERHGGKAVVLARFIPIVRTFVPFVAGAASMRYTTFAFYNVAGAALWVGSCFGLGYAVGNVTLIRENFWAAALVIVAVSLIPVIVEWTRVYLRRRDTRSAES